ncbi:hypothetical protein [Sphingomonas astaxanthinifaciens]|uniref:Lipoprotein n=1 Tax=Sphingomonas astaxanthinifaciens DSM 22298 TaxID=1123267 RepID=A0ABQ5Z642_9SPHN|nr:hypothetical protein [Sphingomonas astaxanthinifaciens]GLR46368.1 hypothetical protein GCM10007925_00790 [Sphingomonas astaxanthinifaciens DSM 22298]
MSGARTTRRRLLLVPLLGASLGLGGCVAGMAAGAISAAATSGRKPQGSFVADEGVKQAAIAACSAEAAKSGAVAIIDSEQRSATRVVVWGSAGTGPARHSFECHFDTRIVGFKLRRI